MGTMNISLPDSLKSFVDEQVDRRGYGTSSEYVRELIRCDQDRQSLRNLLLAGGASKPTTAVDAACFDSLRKRARGAGTRRPTLWRRAPSRRHLVLLTRWKRPMAISAASRHPVRRATPTS
jgi:antitoxin ParD1/3/4